MSNRQNPFKTNQFKELQKDWYKKLKDSGFNDAESNEDYLKEWDSHYFQIRNNPDTFQIKQEYYYQATHFLLTGLFINETEKQIWRLHVEGICFREIARRMSIEGLHHTSYCKPDMCELFCPVSSQEKEASGRFNKDKVNVIVKRLREAMLGPSGKRDGECRKKI